MDAAQRPLHDRTPSLPQGSRPDLAEGHGSPHWQEVAWPSPERLAAWVAQAPHRAWLDSALSSHPRARFSFLSAEPLAVLKVDPSGRGQLTQGSSRRALETPYDFLEDWLRAFRPASEKLAGFCGGAWGFLSYESHGGSLPLKPRERCADLPDAYFALVDTGLVMDHARQQAWVFSWGIGPDLFSQDPKLASLRAQRFSEELTRLREAEASRPKIHSIQRDEKPCGYLEKVRSIREAIFRGDCYQVNLSQRISLKGSWSPEGLYLRLRNHSPAPQMAFFNLGELQILSASPETLMETEGRVLRSFPIKGTRPRGRSPAEDRQLAKELLESKKDAAELLMIVDLVRNDLGKVCDYGSVRVPSLKHLETLPQVHHLVAQVEGILREGLTPLRALLALSPGGSITGAPKLKAMEIIQALEQRPRGVYTGSLGFFGFNGGSNFNIAIRTSVLRGDRLDYFAGGGIVADSDPDLEYQETLHKTAGLFRALGISPEDL